MTSFTLPSGRFRSCLLILAVLCACFFLAACSEEKKGPVGLKAGQSWKEPVTGMTFSYVPSGNYTMGSETGGIDERPPHSVSLSAFWMGRHEVTQQVWKLVMEDNPAAHKGKGTLPMENVSWNDVQKFIRKLNQKTGERFRLPTEAEWEYACRSRGKSQVFAGGYPIGRVGWYDKNSDDKTRPVGLLTPNGLGLYDMSGNVWEWVQDDYSGLSYMNSDVEDPVFDEKMPNKVARGGAYDTDVSLCRCMTRGYNDRKTYRASDMGFRLVRYAK